MGEERSDSSGRGDACQGRERAQSKLAGGGIVDRVPAMLMVAQVIATARAQDGRSALLWIAIDAEITGSDIDGPLERATDILTQRLALAREVWGPVQVGGALLVMLANVRDSLSALVRAREVRAVLERALASAGDNCAAAAVRIGIALFPDDGDDVGELLDCAERAATQVRGLPEIGVGFVWDRPS
jgi:predicted signal transduction protein with EAL and GGDEF domain